MSDLLIEVRKSRFSGSDFKHKESIPTVLQTTIATSTGTMTIFARTYDVFNGKNRISTRLSSAAAMRLSIASEWPS